MSRSLVVAVVLAGACSPSGAQPTTIDDRRSIPAPEPTPTRNRWAWWDWLGDFQPHVRARGVTPLDEAPDSTWFTNRNGVRRLSPAAIRRGPGPHPAPRDGRRWVVVGMKQDGVAIGVRARDEAGDAFYLKLDPRGHDEVETGADVVVQRLLFAAGYNVPENDIVYVTRDALSVEPPMREADLDTLLARAAREPDGRYRVLASRAVAGKPVGGIVSLGTRVDDPNDQIPHEDRRDMRGLYSLAAWLNHTDIKPANTLEAWLPDRDDPSRGHVVHYLLDFGKALGAMARIDQRPDVGFAHYEEPPGLMVEHAAIGAKVPWDGIGPFPDLRGLGFIESERFDPARWKTLLPWVPFEKADRFDKLWGARIVASFTPAQIRAAVAAARYSDPRTVEYLVDVLVDRQRKTITELFRGVAPLEAFELRGGKALCFVDLWARHDLGGPAATYTAELHDAGFRHARARRDGRVCFPAHASIVDIHVTRPGHVIPPTRVHVEDGRVTAIVRH